MDNKIMNEDLGSEALINKEQATTKLCDSCQSEIPIKATRCRYCSAALSKKSQEENEGFTVVREETETVIDGFPKKLMRLFLIIQDEQVKNILSGYLGSDARFFDSEPKISAEELFTVLPMLKRDGYNSESLVGLEGLKNLMAFLGKEYEAQRKQFEAMIAEKKISFEGLSFLFGRGTKVFGFSNGAKVGTEVLENAYGRSLMCAFFSITGEVIKSNGERFFKESHQFFIYQFKGVKPISELTVQPLDDATMESLMERGKTFARLGLGCRYINYRGPMIYKTKYYTTKWKADGRAMVDGSSFNKINADYEEFGPSQPFGGGVGGRFRQPQAGGRSEDDESTQVLPPDSYYKSWPTIGGFSFTAKKWGELLLENIGEIKFDDGAFDRLVLPLEQKKMVKAMVQNAGDTSFSDLITGKGAGCIFLLHGPPGSGKTLTAEAIAELLHRPLYSVGVGELGTTTETLEKVLKDLLDVASVWNAVVLIDEADIFLERRVDAGASGDSAIKRNAMVGIFLRLLEYHQGILFLTTNRVEIFDEAFHSRVNVTLRYRELGQEARKKVWENFLLMAGIGEKGEKVEQKHAPSSALSASSDFSTLASLKYSCPELDLEKLSAFKLNGRQIRNVVRLATSLARSEWKEEHEDEQKEKQKEKETAAGQKVNGVELKPDETVLLKMVHFEKAIGVTIEMGQKRIRGEDEESEEERKEKKEKGSNLHSKVVGNPK